jgi:hypothetical protein
VTTTPARRTARGDAAPGRWTVVWLSIAGLVYVASVVDLARSGIAPVSVVSGAGLMLVMVGAGAVIVLRTDVPLLGWLLVATGATVNSFSAIEAATVAGRTDAQLGWVSIIGFSPTPLLAAVVLFPTGRASTRSAQIVLVGGVGAQVVAHGLQVAAALDLIGGDWASYRAFADTGVAATVLAALVLHVVTYRRRPRTEQLQVKYLILALFLSAISFPVNSGGVLTVVDSVPQQVSAFLDVLGPGLVPVAIVLAMTRYRPYEIDRLISRTLAYPLLLGLLGALFVGGVALIAALLPTQDSLAVVLTTLAVVGLLDPLRAVFRTSNAEYTPEGSARATRSQLTARLTPNSSGTLWTVLDVGGASPLVRVDLADRAGRRWTLRRVASRGWCNGDIVRGSCGGR